MSVVAKLEEKEKKIIYIAFQSSLSGPGSLCARTSINQSKELGFSARYGTGEKAGMIIINYDGQEAHVPFGNIKQMTLK